MYSLYFTRKVNGVIESLCFYDDAIPTTEYKVISPNLNKKAGNAGSLTFTLPPTNIFYSEIDKDSSEIFCLKENKEIWRGRIYSDKEDFYNQKFITCEGELTYLNDTTMGYQKLTNKSWYQIIDFMLKFHNLKNGDSDPGGEVGHFNGPYDKRIYIGYWPLGTNDTNDIEFKGETVLEIINNISKEYNVYPKITWRDSKRYLDFEKGFQAGVPNNIGTTTTSIEDDVTTSPIVIINGSSVTAIANDLVITDTDNKKHIYDGNFWREYVEGKGRYFDRTIDQKIEFGYNLLDFTKTYDASQLVTAVTIRGSKRETSDDSDAYYDLTFAPSWEESGTKHDIDQSTGKGMPYAYNINGVQSYGFREAMLEVETTTDDTNYIGVTSTNIVSNPTASSIVLTPSGETHTAQNKDRVLYNNVMYKWNGSRWSVYESPAVDQMKTIAINYLRVSQFDNMTIEISAVDLTLLGIQNVQDFDVYFDVEVVSYPHNLDRYFPIMEMTIPLDKPEEATYSMGVSEDITLTGSSQRANEEFYEMIKALPTEESVLNAAKNNADQLIKGAISGYVTLRQTSDGHTDAIIISTSPGDGYLTHPSWIWTSGGLAFYGDGLNGDPSRITAAISMNGEICADYITAGKLSADFIQGGTLTIATSSQMSANAPWIYMNHNSIGFKRGTLTTNTEVGYIKPQVLDTGGRNWMVYNTDRHCYECDAILVGNHEARSGTANDHVSIMAFGGDNDIYTVWHPGTTYTVNVEPDPNNPNRLRPPLGENVYILKLPDRYVFFKRGIAIAEQSTISYTTSSHESNISGLYNGDIEIGNTTYKVKNGLITTEEVTNQT